MPGPVGPEAGATFVSASVSITGAYSATLASDGFGVWTGTDSSAGRAFSFKQSNGDLTAVPEPATWALLGLEPHHRDGSSPPPRFLIYRFLG